MAPSRQFSLTVTREPVPAILNDSPPAALGGELITCWPSSVCLPQDHSIATGMPASPLVKKQPDGVAQARPCKDLLHRSLSQPLLSVAEETVPTFPPSVEPLPASAVYLSSRPTGRFRDAPVVEGTQHVFPKRTFSIPGAMGGQYRRVGQAFQPDELGVITGDCPLRQAGKPDLRESAFLNRRFQVQVLAGVLLRW